MSYSRGELGQDWTQQPQQILTPMPNYGYNNIPTNQQIVNPMANYGTDMIINEIVKSLLIDNKIDISKFFRTIFGTILTKYFIENTTNNLVYILNFPNEIFNIFMKHYQYIKTYIKYIVYGFFGFYKVYKYEKHYPFIQPSPDINVSSQFIMKDNIIYNLPYQKLFFIIMDNEFKQLTINFNSVVYHIVSNENINYYNDIMNLYKNENEVLIGSRNSNKYVYELDVYKNLGNMITEFITLNKKIKRNVCSMMFCFMGKSGTGKTQFCYYVNNLKLCDRIIRINLINTNGQFLQLSNLLERITSQLLNSNVIFIEELDRYFDDLLNDTISIKNIKQNNNQDKDNLMNIVKDERKNEKIKKLQNFVNTLHLLADGELLPKNNIIIINSNNLQSIYTKLEQNGIKKTVIDALKSRIQVIEFKLPSYKDICDITHDIFNKCEKDITYEQVKEIIPTDIKMCYRTFDSKIVLSHGNPQKLKELLLEKPENIILPVIDTEEDDINKDDINKDDINKDDINKDNINNDDINKDDYDRDSYDGDNYNNLGMEPLNSINNSPFNYTEFNPISNPMDYNHNGILVNTLDAKDCMFLKWLKELKYLIK